MHRYRPYLSLAGILILGTVLRFAQLDGKPVWLDEILTGLFSLGRSYQDIPLDVVLPLGEFADIFTLNTAASCPPIAQTVATESTHPPLFFCLTHGWLSRIQGSWIWQTRSLSVVFGVGAIAAMYVLNRVAFSRQAGLMGAAVMAVSPFAVYLSQEARHYTLSMLLITLSLIGFIQIQKDLYQRGKVRIRVGISWAIANTLGLYTHYFFLLALGAEWLTILALIIGNQQPKKVAPPEPILPLKAELIRGLQPKYWIFLGLYGLLPLLFYLPWLPTLYNHFSRPETEWFKPFEPSWVDSFTPIFQTLAGWLVMIVAFPVESQPIWVVIPSAIFMILFAGWFLKSIFSRVKILTTSKRNNFSSLALILFTGFVLLEYLAIVYLLGKDITSAVRYHFIYYPSICALLGASLTLNPTQHLVKVGRQVGSPTGIEEKGLISTGREKGEFYLIPIFLIVGVISSVFVVSNWVFQKPYDPEGVAQTLNLEPAVSVMVVVGYENTQEVALGLSFALELDKIRENNSPRTAETYWVFMKRSPSYQSLWDNLVQVPELAPPPLNLWIVAPGLRQREYPPQLLLGSRPCTLDSSQYYRLGIPYQLYRCGLR